MVPDGDGQRGETGGLGVEESLENVKRRSSSSSSEESPKDRISEGVGGRTGREPCRKSLWKGLPTDQDSKGTSLGDHRRVHVVHFRVEL